MEEFIQDFLKLEKQLAKYKNLLSINEKALASVSGDKECIEEYDMPLYALEDIVSYLSDQVTQCELELKEMV